MKYLYDVFVYSNEKGCSGLDIALAMYRADYPDHIDADEGKKVRAFMIKHYDALVEAFKVRDREHFDAVIDGIIAAEIAEAEQG